MKQIDVKKKKLDTLKNNRISTKFSCSHQHKGSQYAQ